jgi:hypothetical protein
MTALTASTVPLAVRVKSARYDGMITGYLRGAPRLNWADPGGCIAASFVVDQRLGFRSDMIPDYSRIYVYNKRNGDCVFEGDVTHPGRSASTDGALLEVQVDGGAARLNDWSGARIYVDRDMQAWTKIQNTSIGSTTVAVGDDRGGSGVDALTLAFLEATHVETNYRVEAIYQRLIEAGQELGWFNYAWDGGHTSGSPGWLVRGLVTPPSTVARSQILNVGGSGGSGAVVGGSIPVGANIPILQLIWTSGSSNTGALDNVWVSILRPVVISRLKTKDGSFLAGGSYNDYVTAAKVWGDMLGTDLLSDAFDGANARVDTGAGYEIAQLAYPDGTTPAQIAEDLMKFEPACTYFVGPSTPGIDKYSFEWVARSTTVRYEAMVWTDEHTGGIQPVDQYNVAVARWKTPVGNTRITTTTQSIPEMTAAGRTRRFFQDLTDTISDTDNAVQANAAVLEEHRFPKNGGRVTIRRPIVDLFTGRRVEPFEIQPGYMMRLAGIEPNLDALNASTPNGSTVCRIVTNDYNGDDNSADLDLDSVPWSLFRAIARTKKPTTPQRKAL